MLEEKNNNSNTKKAVVVYNSKKYGDIVFNSDEVTSLGDTNISRAIMYMDEVYTNVVSAPKRFIMKCIKNKWHSCIPEKLPYPVPSVEETKKRLKEQNILKTDSTEDHEYVKRQVDDFLRKCGTSREEIQRKEKVKEIKKKNRIKYWGHE
jgi:hypothetical protein